MINYSVYIIRFLAISLIVNSHLDDFYPYSAMAFGGHLGNSMFYLISGYGLALSYGKRPLGLAAWAKRRFLKIIIPMVVILGVLNIGNLQGFVNRIFEELIWHNVSQVEDFLPVLWGLYALFIPIYRLNSKRRRYLLLFFLLLTLILFVIKMQALTVVPRNLPSLGIFFSLNAVICFVLGVSLVDVDIRAMKERHLWFKIVAFSAVLISQILHQIIGRYLSDYILLNFYLNFVSVVALFMFLMSFAFSFSRQVGGLIANLATSSLAIYLVHYKVMYFVDVYGIGFPFNVILVFVACVVCGYPLARLTSYFSNLVLERSKEGEQAKGHKSS